MELRVHDLLRLRRPAVEGADQPAWVAGALARAPWVVMRRNVVLHGKLAVGVRGATRAERFAALIDPDMVLERAAPEDLAPGGRLARAPFRAHLSFDAMARLAPVLDAAGLVWGPGGAAGFELASGVETLTSVSDLDIVLRSDGPLRLSDLGAAAEAAGGAPVRVDVVVETPAGGVALDELLGPSEGVLLRTRDGPRLVSREDVLAGSTTA